VVLAVLVGLDVVAEEEVADSPAQLEALGATVVTALL
jgi:hypothetical protein